MEMQYRTLVSETSGRECSMKADVARALPLVTEAGKLVSAGKPVPALDVYSNAIKVHPYQCVAFVEFPFIFPWILSFPGLDISRTFLERWQIWGHWLGTGSCSWSGAVVNVRFLFACCVQLSIPLLVVSFFNRIVLTCASYFCFLSICFLSKIGRNSRT